jgi:hypothetical protein
MAWKQQGTYPPEKDNATQDFRPAFQNDPRGWPGGGAQSLVGRRLFDTEVWNPQAGGGIGTVGPSDSGSSFVHPVREQVTTNAPLQWWPATENVTRWTPWTPGPNGYSQGGLINQGTAYEVEPLPMSSHPMNGTGNFFQSDPSLWGASLSMQTDWDHMALGGTVILGHQSFARSPGQAQFSPEFYPSTIYEPAPAFGSVAPKVV